MRTYRLLPRLRIFQSHFKIGVGHDSAHVPEGRSGGLKASMPTFNLKEQPRRFGDSGAESPTFLSPLFLEHAIQGLENGILLSELLNEWGRGGNPQMDGFSLGVYLH